MDRQLKLIIPPSLGRARAAARGDLIRSELGRWLERDVRVQVAENYQELEKKVMSGSVDLAWAPPSVCARLGQSAHAIFKAVRSGRSTYRSALVVRAGEVGSLEALRDGRAAWTDPLSTAGYLLPDAYLRAQGLDPATLFSNVAFVGSDEEALCAVDDGKADVTGIYVHEEDGSDFRESVSQQAPRVAHRLSLLAVTPPVGSDGLVVLSSVSRVVADEIVARIERMQGAPVSPLLLSAFDAEALELARSGAYGSLSVDNRF